MTEFIDESRIRSATAVGLSPHAHFRRYQSAMNDFQYSVTIKAI